MSELKLIDFLNRKGLNSKEYGDLILFDYSMETQATFDWDEITLSARGIVFNKVTGELVARPFSKFFNYEELNGAAGKKLPEAFQPNLEGPFRALEKVDGSAGIVFNFNNEWRVNTRGSFESDQAIWAKKWLDKNIKTEHMDPTLTYMFEIIYPENRIVVNYGNKEAMVLIGVIDKETGIELDYTDMKNIACIIGCDLAKIYHFEKFEDIFISREKLTVNEEGWVVTFENGYRCKLKGEEYLKVHRILSSVTPLHFWRAINLETFDMPDIEETILMLPDEFRDAAKNLVDITIKAHQESYEKAVELAKQVPEFSDDKDGKKNRYFWIRTNLGDANTSDVLAYLEGKHDKLRMSIHRRCRPDFNTYDNIKIDHDLLNRLKRILAGNN